MIISIKNTECKHNLVQWVRHEGILHIKCCDCGIIFNTTSQVRDMESEPFKTPEGLYSKMQYPIAIDIDTPMITKEQLWYICRVYPEPITQEEAKKDYDKATLHDNADNDCPDPDSDADDSYWRVAANIVNKLTRMEVTKHG